MVVQPNPVWARDLVSGGRGLDGGGRAREDGPANLLLQGNDAFGHMRYFHANRFDRPDAR